MLRQKLTLPTPFRDARATSTGIATTQNNLRVSDAGIEEVRVQMQNAEREWHRYEKLLKQDAVTPQQYDQVHTAYEAIKARYEQLLRAKQSTALTRDEQTHRLEQNEAGIRLAEAAVDLAKLNLSYTVIVATCDGVTGRKDIHEGQLVQPGQTMVDIVDGQDLWVIANYRETPTSAHSCRFGSDAYRRCRSGCDLYRHGGIYLGCHGSRLLAHPTRQCYRQLCKGGTARACPYQPER